MDSLTDKQREVMKWLERGWEIKNVYRQVCEIPNKVVCNLITMKALERMGFVEKVGGFTWRKAQ